MKPYPYGKVLIGFTFAPAIAGIVVTCFGLFPSPFEGRPRIVNWVLLDWVLGYSSLFLGMAMFAMLTYGPPAFFLAIIYILLKLHKNLKGYVLVTVMGGLGALAWYAYHATCDDDRYRCINKYKIALLEEQFGISSYYFLGAISSLIMAYFVLPKKEPVDWDEFEDPDIP